MKTWVIYMPRREASEETKPANSLSLDLSLLNWERITFCWFSQPLPANKKKLYTSLVVWALFWGWERERGTKRPVRWEMSTLGLPFAMWEFNITRSSFTGYSQLSISIEGVTRDISENSQITLNSSWIGHMIHHQQGGNNFSYFTG